MKLNLVADISSIEETLNAVKGNFKKFEQDLRQFRPNLKNDKKEYRATVRFLPQGLEGIQGPAGKEYFVERWDHAFQENGMWYIEKCPTVINKVRGIKDFRCPVCEARRSDYKTNDPVLVERAKSRKLKKSFVTNVLIIEDPQFPENNGKVMYWNLPKEIVTEIEKQWKPESKKKKSVQPYCPIKGMPFDLVLKMNPDSGYPTYAGSTWLEIEPLSESEDEIVKILNSTIDLSEFAALPTNFKTYEELSERFAKITMGEAAMVSATKTVYAEDLAPQATAKIRSTISTSPLEASVPSVAPATADDNDDWLDD